jgi:hypothetical protein
MDKRLLSGLVHRLALLKLIRQRSRTKTKLERLISIGKEISSNLVIYMDLVQPILGSSLGGGIYVVELVTDGL